MQANQDKTGKMGQKGGAKQQPDIMCGNNASGKMKDVAVKKAANMKLCKGEDYNRGKI